MASFPKLCLNTSAYTTFDVDEEAQRVNIHISDEIPLLHADHESNTFIVDRSQLTIDEQYTARADLLTINDMPIPFGQQFCFLMYEGNGEFFSWSNSLEYSTGKVCVALKGFGYTASVITAFNFRVDAKGTFTLKLKHGH